MADITTVPDTAGQTATLAALNAQGILTDADFVDKNTELVGRL